MMQTKILHIVRHGKASQDYFHVYDYDRPLVEKGILNNITVAKQLLSQFEKPGLIISSHAARALHTAHIFAQVMRYPHARVQVNERLYMNGENEVFSILKSLPDELESVMLVGHNPDVTFVANAYGCRIESIPTSGVATIRFKTEQWSEISKSNVIQSLTFEKD